MQKRNKNPLVSVVIAAYNEGKYIDKCLNSLKHQSYKNKEIIVVDDGSTDKTGEIAKRLGVRVYKVKHAGPGSARNFGVKRTKGKILAFLDADMKYNERYIEKLIIPIVEKRAIGTFVKEEFVANKENIWSRCWSINSNLPVERRIPLNFPETENIFRAILKNKFEKSGGFEVNEGYTDDSSVSRKLNLKALIAPGAISYHFNPSSLSEVFYSARWIGRGKIFSPSVINFLRFSPINSFRVSLKYLIKKAPFSFIIFKFIYDFGVLCGIFFSRSKNK